MTASPDDRTGAPELLALVQACREDPDEDGPRLVLADWLEENGQAVLASAVRLSLLHDQLPSSDPRRSALRAELDDPASEIGAWLRPLRRLFPASAIHRGLLRAGTTLDGLLAQRLDEIPPEYLPWLEALHLDRGDSGDARLDAGRRGWLWRFTSLRLPHLGFASHWHLPALLRQLAVSDHFAHVSRLDLSGVGLTVESLRSLLEAEVCLPALRSLNLGRSSLHHDGLRLLGESPLLARLTTLELRYAGPIGATSLRDLTCSPHVRGLVHLELDASALDETLAVLADSRMLGRLRRLRVSCQELGREGCQALERWPADRPLEHLDLPHLLTDADLGCLARSPLLRSLRSLEVGSPRVTVFGLRHLLRGLPGPGLRRLNLDACQIGDEGAALLARCPALADLRELDLTDAGIGPEGVGRLARSPHFRRLEYLRLCSNRLGVEGVRALTGNGRTLPGLRSLDLGRTYPSRAGLEALFRSGLAPRLEALRLTGNQLHAGGAAVLAGAANLAGLRYLDLSMCALRDAGVAELARSPHLTGLRALTLLHNRISDEGAQALASAEHLNSLCWLDLRTNTLGDAGAQALLARRSAGWAMLGLHENRLTPAVLERSARDVVNFW
jgi:uncharacterized protein (TIGR02996 family)